MRIGVLTAAYGRKRLFYEFCEHINNIEQKLPHTFYNVAAISERTINTDTLEARNFDSVFCKNFPLSNKFNTGLEAFRQFDPEYVIVLGSDDFIDYETLRKLIRVMELSKADLIGITDAYMFDLSTNGLYYFSGYCNHRKGETVGAGRCFSRRILQELDYNLWKDGINCGLDRSTTELMKDMDFTYYPMSCMEDGLFLCGIKTRRAITKRERYKSLVNIPIEVFQEKFPHLKFEKRYRWDL